MYPGQSLPHGTYGQAPTDDFPALGRPAGARGDAPGHSQAPNTILGAHSADVGNSFQLQAEAMRIMEQANNTDNHTNKSQSHQQQQQLVRIPGAGQIHANATSSNGNAVNANTQHGGLMSQEDLTAGGGLMGNPYPSQRQSQPEQQKQQRRQQQRQQLQQQQQPEDEPMQNLPTFMDGGMAGRQNQPKRVAQGSPLAREKPAAGKLLVGDENEDPKETYGLIGILKTIRLEEPALNSFTLGMDLTTLGLNLNSTESLHTSFSSPWQDAKVPVEPDFVLPTSYCTQPLQFKGAHLQKFSIETLFYIFYNMPGDLLQAIAAVELYRRNYFFHSELKWWFEKSDDPSKSAWSYFDPREWKKRYFWEFLEESLFLKEADVTNLSHIDMSAVPNFQEMQAYIDRDEPPRL